MSILDRLKNPALTALIHDQRIKELVTRREFRLTEAYLHQEFISQAADEEIHNPLLKCCDGYAELSCEVKKRFLPAIPFSARFTIHGVEFSSFGKRIYLRVEQVKPLDLEWVTRRMADKVPFLEYGDGLLVCDLTKVPRLANLFACQVKGIKLADFLSLRELAVRDGEVVGRLGVII
jgi:hypothetical protein